MQEELSFLSTLPWEGIIGAISGLVAGGGGGAHAAVKARKKRSAAERENTTLSRQVDTAVKRAEEAEEALADSERERRMILRELELCRGRG